MAKRRISKRGMEWLDFSGEVLEHIEKYTVPQYGDKPKDQVEEWEAEECVLMVRKYASRFGKNRRTSQDDLDLLKIAHYAGLAFVKMGFLKKH